MQHPFILPEKARVDRLGSIAQPFKPIHLFYTMPIAFCTADKNNCGSGIPPGISKVSALSPNFAVASQKDKHLLFPGGAIPQQVYDILRPDRGFQIKVKQELKVSPRNGAAF